MHIHILGICGTFMGGLALLARELGYTVSGSDANVYPPMSTQLLAEGITLCEGYDPAHLEPAPDLVVIGNALSRGNPAVEYVLAQGLPYTSGPQWLAEHVLSSRWVLGVAGTHGKTTTASILAWLLEANDLKPGFLIGGIPGNFGVSARLGDTPFFVVEADEYDTAFFDKRSKFVHYRPRTLILNNLEFDHADIFSNLEAIKIQFHHLIRTIPGNGLIISNRDDVNLPEVLQRGCWTPVEHFAHTSQHDWSATALADDYHRFEVSLNNEQQGVVDWPLIGEHNMLNALAAIAAARHAGVPADLAIESLGRFAGIKRRMEVRGEVNGITVYDDFAHHPTAIATTLAGLRKAVGRAPIVAILEPRSNTMRMGVHTAQLATALRMADQVMLYKPDGIDWDMTAIVESLNGKAQQFSNTTAIIDAVVQQAVTGSHILVMSNGGFENIHVRLLEALSQH
ncbi:MAG: UDP-N-acetylmuramate:L-alanyl-gamma-D-glutamyl-meso-diaminopimelate ligase [Gammaproteobacteria bacterium]